MKLESVSLPQRGRDLAPDVLKLIACVGVIVIHVCGQGVTLFEIGSFDWLVCTFWDSLARFAVPVFFMCTGAMMLSPERDLTVKRIYKQYFFRILIILLFWAWVYYIFRVLGEYIVTKWLAPGFLLDSVKETLRFNHHLHLYYLQILLLFYVCLPVFRSFVKSATYGEQKYAVILWLVLGIAAPLLLHYRPFSYLGGLLPVMQINMVWSAAGYALLGHMMYTREPERKHLKVFVLMFLAGLLLTFGCTVASSLISGSVDLNFLEGMSPGPALCTAGLFGSVRIVCRGRDSNAKIARLTKASFCVYLIHHFFIMVFRQIGFDVTLFSPLIEVPVEAAAVIVLSLVGWKILSVIPFVKDHLI